MNWKKLIGDALKRKNAIEQQREAYTAEQRSIADTAGDDALTDEQRSRVTELSELKRSATEQIDAITTEITNYEREQADDERLTREANETREGADRQAARTNPVEATYSQRKRQQEGVSFFTDMYRQQLGLANRETQERLLAHEAEMVDSMSQRAVATGGLGGLIPPQYLVDLAAPIARAGRPTADVVRHLPLPATGMSITVPRQTTGVSAAIQATQNSPVSTTDAAITDLVVPVVTIAGSEDLSRQSLERGEGVDELIFSDLVAAYNVALDAQVLSGSGTGGQMLGILNTAGITQMSAFTAAATAATFWSKLAGAVVAIQSGRYLAPTGIIVHPRRWGWLVSLLDSSNRPLVVPNLNGPNNAQGHYDEPIDTPSPAPAGWLQGIPIYTDASIPTSVGTGPEDQVIVARLDDLLLWEENSGIPRQLRFEQTTGKSLTVALVAYGYAAFTAGRYPLATAILGGNAGAGFGLVAPTF